MCCIRSVHETVEIMNTRLRDRVGSSKQGAAGELILLHQSLAAERMLLTEQRIWFLYVPLRFIRTIIALQRQSLPIYKIYLNVSLPL